MDIQERQHKIESYARGHADLVAALQRFPRAMWHFHADEDPWSIHEIVVHITDSETNSYIRCRRCIAEPGESVMAYDENLWATALHYEEQDCEDALALFKWLRLRTTKLIQTVPDSVWSHTMEHPENGTMTLEDWLDSYERHIPDHIRQMQAIHAAWSRQQGV